MTGNCVNPQQLVFLLDCNRPLQGEEGDAPGAAFGEKLELCVPGGLWGRVMLTTRPSHTPVRVIGNALRVWCLCAVPAPPPPPNPHTLTPGVHVFPSWSLSFKLLFTLGRTPSPAAVATVSPPRPGTESALTFLWSKQRSSRPG